jgi:uncharacterized protein (DUF1778 family)
MATPTPFNPAPVQTSTRIELRVPLELRGRIARAADDKRCSVSDFIRSAVTKQLDADHLRVRRA